MLLLLGTLLLAAVIFLVYRLFYRSREPFHPPGSLRPETPDELHVLSTPDEEIASELEAAWRRIADREYRDFSPRFTGEDVDLCYKTSRLDVLSVMTVSTNTVSTVVRLDNEGREIPVLVRAIMLGTNARLADRLQRYRESQEPVPLPPGAMRVYWTYEVGEWKFAAIMGEGLAAEEETHLARGEAVLLQEDWKEPPFAATVLGPPEPVDKTTVRVPMRLTSVLPAWSYPSYGWRGLSLRTAPDASGNEKDWAPLSLENQHSRQDGWNDPFSGVILFQAGTHEGHVYFGPDGYEDDESSPDEPFLTLQFIDGSEELILVDLNLSVTPAPRARFDGCQPDDTALLEDVLDALRNGDGFWSNQPDPTPALLGDTVTIFEEAGGPPFLDLIALGVPESGDGIPLRVPVRVVARLDSGPMDYFVEAWLSTAPDSFGRIHQVATTLEPLSHSPTPGDSLDLKGMAMGEVREGFLYFARDENQGDTETPDEPFTILWYGPDRLELPMDLSVSR